MFEEREDMAPVHRESPYKSARVFVGVVAVLLVLAWVGLSWWTSMPGRSWDEPLPKLSVQQERVKEALKVHVEKLAGEIGERHLERPEALSKAQKYIERQMTAFGFEVKALPVPSGQQVAYNLEATLLGEDEPEHIVVIGAHYDTAVGSPGANDNATGVAVVLEMARAMAGRRLTRTVRFVFFANEEPPHFKQESMGSLVYAQEARQRGDVITAMFSIESVGVYRNRRDTQQYPPFLDLVYPSQGNFVAFVGMGGSQALLERSIGTFRKRAQIPSEGLSAPSWVEGVDFSDHWSFEQANYPAIMVTDTAFMRDRHYHTANDTPARIRYRHMTLLLWGMLKVARTEASRQR